MRRDHGFATGSLAFLMMCLSVEAFANGVATGGSPSDLVPIETKEVRMESEDILLEAEGAGIDAWWKVTADYVFENVTGRDVKTRVGFPEYACEELDERTENGLDLMCDPKPLAFEEMQTWVNGRQVTQRKGKLKAGHPWAPRLGTVWLFDVVFPAKSKVTISHHYRVKQSFDSSGWVLGDYVTRTGALWRGAIGQARFRVHVPKEVRIIETYQKDAGLSLTTHLVDVKGKSVGELLFEASDWNPTTDLQFGYIPSPDYDGWFLRDFLEKQNTRNPFASITEQCPHIAEILVNEASQAEYKGNGTPSEKEIEKYVALGVGNPKVCRNFVYALHGRRFEDDAINLYFYGFKGFKPGPWPYTPLTPNPTYSDEMLSAHDKYTLRLIDHLEKRLEPCKSCACENKTSSAPTAKRSDEKQTASCSVTSVGENGFPRPFELLRALVRLCIV